MTKVKRMGDRLLDSTCREELFKFLPNSEIDRNFLSTSIRLYGTPIILRIL
jgi:hypothetical protein